MRKIQVFEEEGIFTIRHHRSHSRIFDQTFECEIVFLESLATHLYLSDEETSLDVEMGIAPIVVSFLESVVASAPGGVLKY